jgi:3-methyl-2-oxobutanoate hydroxymethyltransferase
VRNFMDGAGGVPDAAHAYVAAVKTGRFPDVPTHTY